MAILIPLLLGFAWGYAARWLQTRRPPKGVRLVKHEQIVPGIAAMDAVIEEEWSIQLRAFALALDQLVEPAELEERHRRGTVLRVDGAAQQVSPQRRRQARGDRLVRRVRTLLGRRPGGDRWRAREQHPGAAGAAHAGAR